MVEPDWSATESKIHTWEMEQHDIVKELVKNNKEHDLNMIGSATG